MSSQATASAPTMSTGFESISDADRRQFSEQGWLLVRGALSEADRERYSEAVDRTYSAEAAAGRLRPDKSLHLLGGVARDQTLIELLDYPATFPHVWGHLGWNVYSHFNHIDVNPPTSSESPYWAWHQDGYRQNFDIDHEPRPMLSLKVCFVLSDLSVPGRGATKIIPGSHGRNTLPGPEVGEEICDPGDAIEILANPGDAFIFDRRLWHSRSTNTSDVTRKVVFISYTFRWIRPRNLAPDPCDVRWWQEVSPLRRQLIGLGPDEGNYWGVRPGGWPDESIPLHAELLKRGLLDHSRPYFCSDA